MIATTARAVLPDVPRIGFDVHLSPFPGSLYACLAYLGDPCDYDFIMGVSGAAFRRLWNRDDGGNIDLSYLGDEPYRRIFAALGYNWRKVPAQKQAMIEAIRAHIDAGKPVISFGIIGPPEAGIVTGYAEDGAILYGWSYFQSFYQLPADRYYESSDWFETMDKNAGKGLILIEEKLATRPEPQALLTDTLTWAVDLAHTTQRPGLPDHVAGLAAYDAWAEALTVDADYPADDEQILFTRVMVHGDQTTMLEERHAAARFLRQMAAAVPDVADLLNQAAVCYDQAADFVPQVWKWGISMGRDAQEGLKDAQTRCAIAAAVLQARTVEAEGVGLLEEAIGRLT